MTQEDNQDGTVELDTEGFEEIASRLDVDVDELADQYLDDDDGNGEPAATTHHLSDGAVVTVADGGDVVIRENDRTSVRCVHLTREDVSEFCDIVPFGVVGDD